VASDSEPLGRARRTWRDARIERFAKQQRNTGRWISFARITDYYSREGRSILPNEDKRAATYDLLAKGLKTGEFDEVKNRSLVLFLHPAVPPARMTREHIELLDYEWGKPYLEYCWIHHRLFERWRLQYNLPPFPRFEPFDKGSQLQVRQQRPRERRKPVFERALMGLNAAYANGVPDQATVLNKTLCKRVNEKLKGPPKLGDPVSDDSILRAARRRLK
jgi:hypothetical protein